MAVTYTDGFRETFVARSGQKRHWVQQTWFFDVQGSYNCTFTIPIENNPVAGYSKDSTLTTGGESSSAHLATSGLPCWKMLLNNTRFTVGCNNVFGQDPARSFATATLTGIPYPDGLYDSVGRFVYVSLTKKF